MFRKLISRAQEVATEAGIFDDATDGGDGLPKLSMAIDESILIKKQLEDEEEEEAEEEQEKEKRKKTGPFGFGFDYLTKFVEANPDLQEEQEGEEEQDGEGDEEEEEGQEEKEGDEEQEAGAGAGGDDGKKEKEKKTSFEVDKDKEQGRKRSSNIDPKKAAANLKKQQEKMKWDFLIPKDANAWLDFLVALVKKKTKIEYLVDKELKKVISRARPNLAKKIPVVKYDYDAPLCLSWTVEQIGNWIETAGFPYLKQAFAINGISGRRLILVDATALNKMGMTDLEEMRKVTAKIRDLLKIPAPNMLRAIMRIPPFERFIMKKVNLGLEANALTFEKFCNLEGFNYALLKGANKNALIPCTTEVRILPVGVADDDEDEDEELDGEDLSMLNAPTVEYVVRNLPIRDATVAYIIELMLENVFLDNCSRKYGRVTDTWKKVLLSDMDQMCPEERLEFATHVARGLMDELERTAEILSDINLLQRYIQEEIQPDYLEWLQYCAVEFLENVIPIATLLALGELDLETIFKQEPEVIELVDGICEEAETKIRDLSYEFVDGVIDEAVQKVQDISSEKIANDVHGLILSSTDSN